MPAPQLTGESATAQPEPLGEQELAATRREYRLLRRLVVVALWAASALALSLNVADPDLWGHVRYGQDVLRDGHLHRTATYTYTAANHAWINHENLAELAYAVVYEWFDDEGLQLFKCVLGLAILGGMAWVAHRNAVGPMTTAAFGLLVANNLTAFFPVRPQVLSFVCCAAMLVLLELAFTGWSLWLRDGSGNADQEREDLCRWRYRQLAWLVGLPPLFVLWTNTHGGFVAGLLIAGAYLAGRMFEAMWYRGRQATVVCLAIAAVGGLTAAATLINPYGIELHAWLLKSLGTPRPEITEWRAPRPGDLVFWPFVALVATAVGSLVLSPRRRDWVQIAILVLVAWQASMHLRHIAFFAVLCGFWLPPHLQAVLRRGKPRAHRLPVLRLGAWSRWSIATALGLAILLQGNALRGRLSALPVHRAAYPVDAFQWMTFKDIDGKLVAPFNWAQYAIAALSPETTVAFDGRFRTCYPQSVVDMNFDFLLGENGGARYRDPMSGPIDPTAILEFGKPDLVLVDRQYKNAVDTMADEAAKADPPWTLIYQDGVAQLWGRSTIFGDPHSTRYVAPAERLITNKFHLSAFAWPALPVPSVIREIAQGEPSPYPPTDL